MREIARTRATASCSHGAVARNADATSVSSERLLHDTGGALKKSPRSEKQTKEDVSVPTTQ